ncbi:MAG TPA: Xaa-Pro dipeptidyl-peptidase [Kribbellaceae bacterium]|nr:Xaa-Pro dipeptidyl-peptidase [Kribbellaceae bacterium]
MATVHARLLTAVSVLLLAGGIAVTPAVAAPAPSGPGALDGVSTPPRPAHIDGDRTEPVYDYANAIRESVKVDTTMDTDSDGTPDTIAVDIVRPRETDASGVKVPVVMDASPYYECCGRGNESELKTFDSDGVIAKMPLFYDNYFVPRGYGVVGVDIVGTSRSTGCGDVGGEDEIASVVAVIDWLNGRNTAKSLDGTPVTADWTTGAVGMIGKSYDGTLANGVAATGVDGLKTIVPISAISSWYDYTRSGGVPYSLDYMPWLGGFVGHDTPACDAVRAELGENDADESGDYTSFWAERDHVKDASKVKASVFVVHGLSDYNVQPNHFGQWWTALEKNRVPRKIWLGLEEHVDPFEFRRAEWVSELHKWFDYWLQGLNNDVMGEPIATVETAPDQWTSYRTWPQRAQATTVPVSTRGLGSSGRGVVNVLDNPDLTESDIVGTPSEEVAGRQMFLSAPLSKAIRISGTPTVTLRVKADKTTTPVTVRLIEYGQATRYTGIQNTTTETCWGASTPVDDACYREVRKRTAVTDHGMVGRGWIDAAHSDSLVQPEPLTPGQWTTVTVPLRAQDLIVPKGRVLGLAISLSDTEWTTPNDSGASVDIDLSRSHLNLPMTGGSVVAPSNDALPLDIDVTEVVRPNLHGPLN